MKYFLGFLLGVIASISIASYANAGDSDVLLFLREIDQNITTLMRDFRLMREACFLP